MSSAFSIFYSTLSFFSAALVLSLLPWFVRFRSVPGLFVIGWLSVVNFLYGLNAAVFTSDGDGLGDGGDDPMLLRFPAYCEIVTKLLLGMQIVVPTAMLCYTFSIHDWLVRPEERDRSVKRFEHRNLFQLALCFFVPIIYMSLHIAVQGNRFDLVENVGCIPSSSTTVLSWVFIWQVLVIPFAGMLVYGFFTFRYSWSHYCKYYAEYQTTWELIDSDLLFTNAPFGIIRIVRLSVMIVVVMLFSLVVPYYVLSVFYHADGTAFARKPDFYRVDVFRSLNDASYSLKSMRLFLWSGPLYSFLLFAASVDKSILQSFSFVIKKYILRQHVGANPDPSPGIDLSTLTPIPVRRRTHRRVIRKSREYDPPLSALDFDIPLPPRPDPGFRETAPLPPVPSTPLTPIRTPRLPELAFVKDRRSHGFREAMRLRVQMNGRPILSAIVESPPILENDGRTIPPMLIRREDATRRGV